MSNAEPFDKVYIEVKRLEKELFGAGFSSSQVRKETNRMLAEYGYTREEYIQYDAIKIHEEIGKPIPERMQERMMGGLLGMIPVKKPRIPGKPAVKVKEKPPKLKPEIHYNEDTISIDFDLTGRELRDEDINISLTDKSTLRVWLRGEEIIVKLPVVADTTKKPEWVYKIPVLGIDIQRAKISEEVKPEPTITPYKVMEKKPKPRKPREPTMRKPHLERMRNIVNYIRETTNERSYISAYQLYKLCKRYNVEYDVVDWDRLAGVDLEYDERKTILMEMLNALGTAPEITKTELSALEDNAKIEWMEYIDDILRRRDAGDEEAQRELKKILYG